MADMPRSSDSPVLAAEQALRPDRRLVPPTVGEWVQIYQKATPEQLIGWRLSAQMGNWWASYMLTSRMEADWPVLRDALHELREAASRAKFIVNPFTVFGEIGRAHV